MSFFALEGRGRPDEAEVAPPYGDDDDNDNDEEEMPVGAVINELSCDVNASELDSGISLFCFLTGRCPYKFGSWGIFGFGFGTASLLIYL